MQLQVASDTQSWFDQRPNLRRKVGACAVRYDPQVRCPVSAKPASPYWSPYGVLVKIFMNMLREVVQDQISWPEW
eukprot:68652-Amphidinium_carterae.1